MAQFSATSDSKYDSLLDRETRLSRNGRTSSPASNDRPAPKNAIWLPCERASFRSTLRPGSCDTILKVISKLRRARGGMYAASPLG